MPSAKATMRGATIPCVSTAFQENLMAKGQQKTNKEAKKPKKDSSPPKPISAGAVMPTMTTVVADRSKKKK